MLTAATGPAAPRGGELPVVGTGPPGVLAGPPRPAQLLGGSRHAVYLKLVGAAGTDSAVPAVVGILARDAVRLPGTVTLAEAADSPLERLLRATWVTVGTGRVDATGMAGTLSLRIRRWWYPPPPRPPRTLSVAHAALHTARTELAASPTSASGLDRCARAALADHLDLTAPAAVDQLCQLLLGRGPGLTPSGDDALCGLLLAHTHFAGHTATQRLAATVTHNAVQATTTFSASLLTHAARGAGCPEALAFLDALSGHRRLQPALAALRRIGHTSGTALAIGACTGALAALEHRCSARPTRPDREVQA